MGTTSQFLFSIFGEVCQLINKEKLSTQQKITCKTNTIMLCVYETIKKVLLTITHEKSAKLEEIIAEVTDDKTRQAGLGGAEFFAESAVTVDPLGYK